jgi:UDP-3-O-[3-hydroxymyristoyl] N-acetylglucosamine deacetylase
MFGQRTLRRSVHAIGIGVHSGTKVALTIRPAAADSGIRFYRTDIAPDLGIEASAESVSDTLLSTTIGRYGVEIATVEHLMSALWGLGIDNAQVEVQGEEIPILDGSAAPFVDLIQSVGVEELAAPKQFIRIRKKIRVSQGDAVASLSPYCGFKATYTFVADHPVFNMHPKRATIDFGRTSYAEQVSRARSFGLLKELEQAQAIRKCLGSSLENAVGISDDGVLNSGGLRYDDEFVKHKVLDAIGDLYLLGKPILGAFEGYRSGHGLNNQLARALLRCPEAWELVTASKDPVRREAPRPVLRTVQIASIA